LDGVQCLEHAGTEQYLRRLIDILRKSDLNVLYLTTGTCRSLRDAIPSKETVTEKDLRSGGQEEDLQRHCQEFWK
jgi:L-asparaginase II